MINRFENFDINPIEDKEAEINFEIQEGETKDEYLYRIIQYIKLINIESNESNLSIHPPFFGMSKLKEEDLSKIFANAMEISEDDDFNKEKNQQYLNSLTISSGGGFVNDQKDNFDDTGRERVFYKDAKINTKLSDRCAHYCSSMFFVPKINVQEQKEYIQSCVNGKNIYLLGGGYSCQDLLSSTDFKPKSITNIDPFVDEEKISEIIKNSKVQYNLLKIDASSENLVEELKNRGIGKADEIWASFSVPMYLDDENQIKLLFDNISLLLNKNGKCRIYPIQLAKTNGSDFESRVSAIKESLQKIVDTKKFNINIFKMAGTFLELVIKKIED
ncbi:MAG: hypothetical protein PHZ07_03705 [Patescibacteria group bacterium]|nr:hypothetical protein [Patescibacteria group bacterium]MDD4304536.1 hypothetical protein [Patescibacteria group bacterium]MDD4695644.1 hypothetical protein [Patescibacteria group bacterium]